MAGKAKFDQETAFKSIIGADRELKVGSLEKGGIRIECSGRTFWIEI